MFRDKTQQNGITNNNNNYYYNDDDEVLSMSLVASDLNRLAGALQSLSHMNNYNIIGSSIFTGCSMFSALCHI